MRPRPARSPSRADGSIRLSSTRHPDTTPSPGSAAAAEVARATHVDPHHGETGMDGPHDADREVVEHAAVDEQVAVGGAHGWEDAGDGEAGSDRVPGGSAAVHLEPALGEVGRHAEERAPGVFQVEAVGRALEVAGDALAGGERHGGERHVEGRARDDGVAQQLHQLVVRLIACGAPTDERADAHPAHRVVGDAELPHRPEHAEAGDTASTPAAEDEADAAAEERGARDVVDVVGPIDPYVVVLLHGRARRATGVSRGGPASVGRVDEHELRAGRDVGTALGHVLLDRPERRRRTGGGHVEDEVGLAHAEVGPRARGPHRRRARAPRWRAPARRARP